ncbi:MAG: sugar phosphate isomerase/epimerase family protein, partial [Acidimicrobiia bacterium]
HGFETIELFATRSHFDYHDASAIEHLENWLRNACLTLHGIHAPIVVSLRGDEWGPAFSNATLDPSARQRSITEAQAALQIARRIPTNVLVVHLGLPRNQKIPPHDNNREAARSSVEQLCKLTSETNIRLALEIIPNELSTATALVDLLENHVDCPTAGICLDVGHAFLMGDLVEAIETASGHIITTHVHDNGGKSDEHLVPFEGRIDWPAALTALQKVGYEGTILLELGNTSSSGQVLQKAREARARMEEILSSAA